MQQKKAYTLLEILVVVIIITILASLAIPQYNRATMSARGAQAFSVLQILNKAQNAYFSKYGDCSTNCANLDITLPANLNDFYAPICVNSPKDGSGQPIYTAHMMCKPPLPFCDVWIYYTGTSYACSPEGAEPCNSFGFNSTGHMGPF